MTSVTVPPLVLLPLTLGQVKSPLHIEGADDIYHVIAFCVLMLPHAYWRFTRLVWPVLLLSALGACIEVVQPWFGRGAELSDFLGNCLGIAFGVAAGAVLRRAFAAGCGD